MLQDYTASQLQTWSHTTALNLQKRLDQVVGTSFILDNLLRFYAELSNEKQQPQGCGKKETTMTSKKHFVIGSSRDCLCEFDTQEEAVIQAKRNVGNRDYDCGHGSTFTVYQAVAVVAAPVPEAIVTTL